MKLHEMLKICLLSLESRYPECVVEINESLPEQLLSFRVEACPPAEMLAVLGRQAPQLLLAPAYLVIAPDQSAIYVVDRPEEEPAFWIYCGGCTPAQRVKQQVRRMAPAR